MRPLIALALAALLAACATVPDPDYDVIEPYFWHMPIRIISAPDAKDHLEVRLTDKRPGRALVTMGAFQRAMSAEGALQTRFLLDREKNEAAFRAALVAAFAREHMDCTPLDGSILPTRFAFEFAYRCAGSSSPSTAAR